MPWSVTHLPCMVYGELLMFHVMAQRGNKFCMLWISNMFLVLMRKLRLLLISCSWCNKKYGWRNDRLNNSRYRAKKKMLLQTDLGWHLVLTLWRAHRARWSHDVSSNPTSLSPSASGALQPLLPWQPCRSASWWGLDCVCVCTCVKEIFQFQAEHRQ